MGAVSQFVLKKAGLNSQQTKNINNLHLAIARGAFLCYNKRIQNHKTACRKLVLI